MSGISSGPLVSVVCVTYNHENFIRQCFDGFILQKTTFPFEVLVHEDASTDNTAFIVKEYEAKYPYIFRCVYQRENQFKKQNTLVNILLPMARGKYIAHCEGDDYWTDPYKLQKQVNFLEANPAYILCAHLVNIKLSDSIKMDHFTPGTYTIKDVIATGRIYNTVSVVFRNSLTVRDLNFIRKLHKNLPFYGGDQAILLLLMSKGDGYVMDEYMAAYRKHDGGIMNVSVFREGHNMGMYFLLKFFNEYTNYMYDAEINTRRLFWLDLIIRKEFLVRTKVIASLQMFTVGISVGIKYLVMLPYYVVKVLLYRFFFRKR